MGMRVTRNDVPRILEEARRKVEQVIIEKLKYVGEIAVNIAKNNTTPKKNEDGTPAGGTSYRDQSANLRSSIGYLIMKDGEVIMDNGFEPLRATATEGAQTGYSFAEKIAIELPHKYVLVIVAGMNYATFVEKNDYDVLLFTESEAVKLAKQLLTNLKI